jgi:hypothetical protein
MPQLATVTRPRPFRREARTPLAAVSGSYGCEAQCGRSI